MGCSPGRGQQCGGEATVVKNGGGLSSSQGQRRARRGPGERGKGVVRSEGGARLLQGPGEQRGGVAGGVTVALMSLTPLKMVRLRGGLSRGS
jgi:hypothetical protein